MDRYLQHMSMALGIREEALRQEVQKFKGSQSRIKRYVDSEEKQPVSKPSVLHDETMLIAFMIDEDHCREEGFRLLSEGDWKDQSAKKLFLILKKDYHTGRTHPMSHYLHHVEDQNFVKCLVQAVSFEMQKEDKDRAFKDCLSSLMRKHQLKRLSLLSQQITQAEHQKDMVTVRQLVKEYQELVRTKSLPRS